MPSTTELFFRVVQAINFVGLLVLAGAWVFRAAVWRGRRVDPSSRTPDVEARFDRRWRVLTTGAWAAAAAASVVALALAPSWTSLSVLELALLALAAALWRRAFDPPVVVGALVLLALLATPALGGHAVRRPPAAVNVSAALLHMVAAATWAGGLAVLVAVALPAVRPLGRLEQARVLAPVVSRFSDIAVVAVAVVVTSGLYSAWVQLGDIGSVTTTTYGLMLATKLLAFLPLLALGAVNNRWTKPMLARAARGDTASGRPVAVLHRLVALEVLLVVVVIGLSSFLVRVNPPGLGPAS